MKKAILKQELKNKDSKINDLTQLLLEVKIKIARADTALAGPLCLKDCPQCKEDVLFSKDVLRDAWCDLTKAINRGILSQQSEQGDSNDNQSIDGS